MSIKFFDQTAASVTLHCLTGCAIGEIAGLIIASILGFNTFFTIAIAVALAFFFGYLLSLIPLLKAGMTFFAALSLVFAADTLSILTMEVVDNLVMAVIPGALHSGIVDPVFWISLSIALFVAFLAAYPVNKYQLKKGKGHGLMHKHHHADGGKHEH